MHGLATHTRILTAPAARQARIALTLLCLAAAAVIVAAGMQLSFFNDDWYMLLQRPGLESRGGLDAVLAPHNGSMVVGLALAGKVIVAVFGMHSVWPFRVLSAVSWSALGIVVFALARERVATPLALLSAALVLFLGPAWEVTLFFSGINHLWALTLGLLALWLLERDSAGRDGWACAALTLAVAVSNTGLALAAAAACAILTQRRPRRLWIVLVPVAVYALWWLGYGHADQSGVTLDHIESLPGYIVQSLSIGLAALLGLEHGSLPGLIAKGDLAAVIALAGLAVWLVRGGRPRPTALWFAGGLIAFWLLTGASAIPGRGADSSRYQLTDAVLILLILCDLLHATHIPRRALAGLSALTLVIVAANTLVLHDGYRFLHAESSFAAADTGALQIARPALRADVRLTEALAGDRFLSGITAERYIEQTAARGTPPFDTPVALLAAPGPERVAADRILIAAEAIRARPAGVHQTARGCVDLTPPGGRSADAPVALAGVVVDNRGSQPLVLALRRFGPATAASPIGFLPARSRQLIAPPPDGASVRWRLSVINPAGDAAHARVCRA